MTQKHIINIQHDVFVKIRFSFFMKKISEKNKSMNINIHSMDGYWSPV
jgi:hypothetical protein